MRAPDQFRPEREQAIADLRDALQPVRHPGDQLLESAIGGLQLERPLEERADPVPRIGIGDRHLHEAHQVLHALFEQVIDQLVLVRETPVDGPDSDPGVVGDVVLGIAQLMVVLDATIVNIALPSAQNALHFSNDDRQWIVTAYSLAFGSLLLLGGKLSDIFGRKWTFIAGLAGFAIASGIGGASQSFAMLDASRTLQGAFGALLAPAALSLLTTTFTETSERNKAFGVYGAIAGSGASVGLLLGGILTQYLSWRFCMYVNLLFAGVAISGALTLLHNQAPAIKPKIDIPGALTVFGGLFALVYGFNHAETTSWGDPVTVAVLAAGIVLLAVFVAIERRVRNPLLPLRVVLDRNRGTSYLSSGSRSPRCSASFCFSRTALKAVSRG